MKINTRRARGGQKKGDGTGGSVSGQMFATNIEVFITCWGGEYYPQVYKVAFVS